MSGLSHYLAFKDTAIAEANDGLPYGREDYPKAASTSAVLQWLGLWAYGDTLIGLARSHELPGRIACIYQGAG